MEPTIHEDLPNTTSPAREQPVRIEPIQKPGDVTSKQAALRKCHECLNHMPFAGLQLMAKQGLLPRYFVDVEALADKVNDPIAFLAKTDPDTLTVLPPSDESF